MSRRVGRRQKWRMREDLADGRVGYAISEQALQDIPAEDLAPMIAAEMAQLLVQEIERPGLKP